MRPLRIGTDCSGIEAPIQALIQLKIPHIHEWSCEIDKYAQMSIMENYTPKKLYSNIKAKRDLPHVDIYVCGFPCQTFSLAGKREGIKDPRGTIFYDCLRAIKTSGPKVFILENVKGLLSDDNSATFKTILYKLHNLNIYNVYWKVLNTKDYGIPQNRERVFIVGILKDYQKKEFEWPRPKQMKDIHSYIDKTVTKRNIPGDCYKEALSKSKGIFIDLGFIRKISPNSYQFYSPTLTARNILWCRPMHRYATIREKLSLQGFPKSFKQVVSDRQMSKQIGNSMSVNVLKELLKYILNAL